MNKMDDIMKWIMNKWRNEWHNENCSSSWGF